MCIRDSNRCRKQLRFLQSTILFLRNTFPACFSEWVCIRHDAQYRSLQRPYDVLFRVLERHPKCFIICKNGSRYSVSVDHLKPANVPIPEAAPPAVWVEVEASAVSLANILFPEDFPPLPSPFVSRVGRISRPPDRLNLWSYENILCHFISRYHLRVFRLRAFCFVFSLLRTSLGGGQ